MELSSEEGEIPIPINSATSYGGGGNNGHGHLIHHHHHEPAIHSHMISNSSILPVASVPAHDGVGGGGGGDSMEEEHDQQHGPHSKKLVVKYRECLKNHAASMGGNATDGCGEFMPSGEEGTLEALTCSACHCHRNFHRKEVEGQGHNDQHQQDHHLLHHHHQYLHHLHSTNNHPYRLGGRKLLLPPPPPETLGYPTPPPPPGNVLPSRMIMPYNVIGSHHSSLPSDLSDEQDDPHHHHGIMRSHQNKKRFRTKFTQEQKEKMLSFAERVGWKIQKQEESVVQQLCQEIGVKRRVLKVWMHNNKHNLAKKMSPAAAAATTAATTSPP
ncbi:hypothetical protein K1719_007156 [Acacia pycnantha]|nr:hypothetical protein K1719_007156 [Acacia pycnantha]